MIKSRKGQEGFTLIELLVVVLIIGILAAIAIPAFLGQKKGAQDSNAKSLLRNAAIAMESYYADAQNFDFGGTTSAIVKAKMDTIEPNITWQGTDAATTSAKDNQVKVTVNAAFDGYALNTVSASTQAFSYVRDYQAKTAKCKAAGTVPATGTNVSTCTNTW